MAGDLPAGLVGAVLCGGASRRMGTDKALLPIEGRPMAARVADALRAAGASEVIAVGGDADALTALGLRHVPDEQDGHGPLAGIVTALGAAGGPALVVGCDLLRPDPTAMAQTAAALVADVDVAVPVVGTEPQWVHAAWAPTALPALRAALDGGERAIHRAVVGLAIGPVHGLDPLALADADVPADLPAPDRPGGPSPGPADQGG